jgi:enoyl-CoA hydratase
MCEVMSQALLKWRADAGVQAVIIDHAEGRGFCAGGDVVMLARSGDSDAEEAKRFFFAEYRLNHLLFTYPKPTVAIMDGITMGGGVGISLPCDFRIATENTRFAMPETSIGLFPDVGGGWYLPRLPQGVGEFMALTGARLDGAECHYLGLATHYAEQASLVDMVERIATTPQRVQGPIGAFTKAPPEAKIAANLPNIAKLFASDRLEDVLAALEADGSDWASSELATLRTHDFREGVRAVLIDKSGDPQWDPPTPKEVTDEMLDVLFAPLPESEAWTPFPETEHERV